MAPVAPERFPQHCSPPVTSTSDDLLEKDDFVLLDEDSMSADWDGDQTKYIPPTRSQSLTASAKIVLDGMIHEPLTKENIMRNSAPLAKDLGAVAKDAAIAAAGFVRRAWGKRSATNATAAAPGQIAASSLGHESSVIMRSLPAETSSVRAAAAWEPGPHAFEHKSRIQPRLSEQEETAIANAVLDGRLKTGGKHRDDARAFLAAFRKGQALAKAKAKAAEKPCAYQGAGLEWSAEADDGFDFFEVCGTSKRPAIDVHDENARKELRQERAASKGAGDDGADGGVCWFNGTERTIALTSIRRDGGRSTRGTGFRGSGCGGEFASRR
ncbi:MAG: hypothetical protein Q9193_006979 [Seirophora villosa]